ncbi:MAG: DUF2970 domain-containing protein [Burkholderiales bacterium]
MANKVGMLAAFRAVFWSFLGIRKKTDYHTDAQTLSAKQVIVAGIVAGLLFVFSLLAVVFLVLRFAK